MIVAAIASVIVAFRLQDRERPIAEDARRLLQAVLENDSDYIFDHSIESVIDTGLTRENYREIWNKRIGPFFDRCERVGPVFTESNKSQTKGLAAIPVTLPRSGQQVEIPAVPSASELGGMVYAMGFLLVVYHYEEQDRLGRGLSMPEHQSARAKGMTDDLLWFKALGVHSLVSGPRNERLTLEDYVRHKREWANGATKLGPGS